MQFPVNLGAVVREATDISAARKTPLAVCVFMDESSPGDLQVLVRQAFASLSPRAKVTMGYFPGAPVVALAEADIAVIVAGFDENIGNYAADLRAAGVPVMVVTTMPDLVCAIAKASGTALLEADVLSPLTVPSYRMLAGEAEEILEPIELSEENVESLHCRMGDWIIEICKEKRLAFALAFPFVRKPLSLESVRATAVQNAGIGVVVFLPGADMPIMTLNQAKMLLKIAAAYGEPMSLARAKELVVVICGGFAFRAVARQLVAFIPFLGWAFKGAVAYAGTLAMGYAAIEYFEGGGNARGLLDIAGKIREKVVSTVKKIYKQPSVKEALRNFAASVNETVSNSINQAIPALVSLVSAAIELPDEAEALFVPRKSPAALGAAAWEEGPIEAQAGEGSR